MAMYKVVQTFFTVLAIADCAKILVMVTVPSPSLFNIYTPIIEGLHNRKHEVTVQSVYPLKRPLPNMKLLPLEPPQFKGGEDKTKHFLLQLAEARPIPEVYSFTYMKTLACEQYLLDKTTSTLISAGKQFDIVLADGHADCVLAVASVVGKHIIGVLGNGNFPWLYSDVPAPPSYIPNYYERFPSKMTFYQRMINAIDVAAFRIINDFMMQPTAQGIISKHIPQAPSIEEVRNQIALTLTNGDPVMYSPRPTMPNVIDVGGLHCRDAKPLPKELKDFVESTGDEGFIIFGLGSNMKSKFLPTYTRDAILSAFSRLKQKVIWKFEDQLENLPANIKITSWMPQQDLLGHPKTRLFITHAGLLGIQEAVYHGVPVIGMPLFMDQAGNVGRIQELGVGEYINFLNVTSDGLYELMQQVLTDKSYRENAKKFSAIFKDQPSKPLDRAIYWIEYVIRHDGARHFRPAARDLNFFQYFLLDVIACLLLAAMLVTGIVLLLFRLFLKKLFPQKHSKKQSDKKEK